MDVVLRPGRDGRRFSHVRIKFVDFLRLQLLQPSQAKHRLDVDVEQIRVSLKRSFADLLSAPARRAGFDPLINPGADRHLGRIDVRPGVARSDQRSQFLAGLGQSSVEGLGEGEDLSEVIAANYAYSLGAGLVLIPEVLDEISADVLEKFYSSDQNRELSQSRIIADLRTRVREMCSSVVVPENGSLTFVTSKIPYGFAFSEVPSTHLFKYPDLGISIVNGFSAEQIGTPGVNIAALVNPNTVEAPELEASIQSLVPRGVFMRGYEGPGATVQHVSDMIEFFPYDLLMIATHCGDAPGYRWTYEYKDSEGIDRNLVVDIAIGVAMTYEKDLLDVLQFTNFVSLDGVDWLTPKKMRSCMSEMLFWITSTGHAKAGGSNRRRKKTSTASLGRQH
jgi:hypothetical protein